MRLLIKKVSIFCALILTSIMLVFCLENGQSDDFYLRFTSGKKQSLVVGSSRAAQGIIPSIMNKHLGFDDRSGLYNYSFSVSNSPYGPVYLEKIKSKLVSDPSINRVFVVCVDPWTISVEKNIGEEDIFPEESGFLGNTPNLGFRPNLIYLWNYYPHNYFTIIKRSFSDGKTKLHEDGWLEVSVDMSQQNVDRRTSKKIKEYWRNINVFRTSEKRINYLKTTVTYLKTLGDVYIVRLPVHRKMLEIENAYMPNFSDLIRDIADDGNIPLLDMTADNRQQFIFTDGNHLYKKSSINVSESIARWIEEVNGDKK